MSDVERPKIHDLVQKIYEAHRLGGEIAAYSGTGNNRQLFLKLNKINIPQQLRDIIPQKLLMPNVEEAIDNHTHEYLAKILDEVDKIAAQNPIDGLDAFGNMSHYHGSILGPLPAALSKGDNVSSDSLLAVLGDKKGVRDISTRIQNNLIPATQKMHEELSKGLEEYTLAERAGVSKDDPEFRRIETWIHHQGHQVVDKLVQYENTLSDLVRISKQLGMGPTSGKVLGG